MHVRFPILGSLLLCALGCSSQHAGTGDTTDEALAEGQGGDRVYLLAPTDEAPLLFRLHADAHAVKGELALFVPYDGPAASMPQPLAGTRNGSSYSIPDLNLGALLGMPSTTRATLDAHETASGLEGTLTSGSSPPSNVTLSLLKRGAVDADGHPYVARTRLTKDIGSCQVDVFGAEAFSLASASTEAKLNATWSKLADHATDACNAHAGASIDGGFSILLLSPKIISFVEGYSTLYDDADKDRDGEQVGTTLALETGDSLSLFGDLLERTAVDVVHHAIDDAAAGIQAPSPLLADRRAKLKTALDAADADALGKRFALGRRGFVFWAAGETDSRIRSVLVPYEALDGALTAKAKTLLGR